MNTTFTKELFEQVGMDYDAQAQARDLMNTVFSDEDTIESVMMDATYVFRVFIENTRRHYETHWSMVQGGMVVAPSVEVDLLKDSDDDGTWYNVHVHNDRSSLNAFRVHVGEDGIHFMNFSSSKGREELAEVKNVMELKALLKVLFGSMGQVLSKGM